MPKRLVLRLAGAALPLALAACATAPTGPAGNGPPPARTGGIWISAPYNPADFAWSQRPGSNGIRGRSPPGYSCAGLAVGLTPDAPYSRERIQKLYGSVVRADLPVSEVRARVIANDQSDLARFARSTRCDTAGRFSFDGLPDGQYFMIAQVAGSQGLLALMRHVVLRGGDVEDVNLTMTR